MLFIPLIGLSPFLIFNLYRKENKFIYIFFLGIFFGFLPTFLNLFHSFNMFGIEGITSLFDFAKRQATGRFDFNNIFLIPLNSFYLTFPIGVLLILLIVFTKSNNIIEYPLLIYLYPFLSFLLLLSNLIINLMLKFYFKVLFHLIHRISLDVFLVEFILYGFI